MFLWVSASHCVVEMADISKGSEKHPPTHRSLENPHWFSIHQSTFFSPLTINFRLSIFLPKGFQFAETNCWFLSFCHTITLCPSLYISGSFHPSLGQACCFSSLGFRISLFPLAAIQKYSSRGKCLLLYSGSNKSRSQRVAKEKQDQGWTGEKRHPGNMCEPAIRAGQVWTGEGKMDKTRGEDNSHM